MYFLIDFLSHLFIFTNQIFHHPILNFFSLVYHFRFMNLDFVITKNIPFFREHHYQILMVKANFLILFLIYLFYFNCNYYHFLNLLLFILISLTIFSNLLSYYSFLTKVYLVLFLFCPMHYLNYYLPSIFLVFANFVYFTINLFPNLSILTRFLNHLFSNLYF